MLHTALVFLLTLLRYGGIGALGSCVQEMQEGHRRYRMPLPACLACYFKKLCYSWRSITSWFFLRPYDSELVTSY